MKEGDVEGLLKIILSRITGKKFDWRMEGSVNLFIQGLKIEPRDLDITTDDKGIAIFREALKEYVVSDEYNDLKHGYKLICNISGHEVDICSYSLEKIGYFDKIKMVHWNGLELPILPLGYALLFYEYLGREDKIRMINDRLKK